MFMPSSLNKVGPSVIHSTFLRSRKMPPTAKRAPVWSMSVAVIQPMISPEVRANPLFRASYIPLSGSLIHPEICDSFFRMMSTVPSLDSPSTMKYSRFGYPCASTDRIVCSMYFPEFHTGVTSEIRGHTAALVFAGALSAPTSGSVAMHYTLDITKRRHVAELSSTSTMSIAFPDAFGPSAYSSVRMIVAERILFSVAPSHAFNSVFSGARDLLAFHDSSDNWGVVQAERKHHKVFLDFRHWTGLVPAGFEADFLGSRYRTSFFMLWPPRLHDRHIAPEYPPFDDEYFEWIDLLEAVA